MGCGTSSHVTPSVDDPADGGLRGNGATAAAAAGAAGVAAAAAMARGGGGGGVAPQLRAPDADDLPTVVLPDSPARPKPPLAFEIPIEPIVEPRRTPPLPPPRLQRLLQQSPPDITLPDIEGKLADAETRRMSFLQQRAASASKRAQKAMKLFTEMETFDRTEDLKEATEKYGSSNTLKIPSEPETWTDRNI